MSTNENSALEEKLDDNPNVKNDQQRFSEGILFRGKLFGVEDVKKETGDEVCQESMVKLKAVLAAKKESKQRVCIKINLEGIEIVDEKTNTSLYKHSVNRISYIARDVKDAKAIGYIYKNSENSFQYFGLRTIDQAQVVFNTLKDLFEVVLKIRNTKKKENERTTLASHIYTDTSEVQKTDDSIKKIEMTLVDTKETLNLIQNDPEKKIESILLEVGSSIHSENKKTDPFGLLELSDTNQPGLNPISSNNLNENFFSSLSSSSSSVPSTQFNINAMIPNQIVPNPMGYNQLSPNSNPMIAMNNFLMNPGYMGQQIYQNPNPFQNNTGFQNQANSFGNENSSQY